MDILDGRSLANANKAEHIKRMRSIRSNKSNNQSTTHSILQEMAPVIKLKKDDTTDLLWEVTPDLLLHPIESELTFVSTAL